MSSEADSLQRWSTTMHEQMNIYIRVLKRFHPYFCLTGFSLDCRSGLSYFPSNYNLVRRECILLSRVCSDLQRLLHSGSRVLESDKDCKVTYASKFQQALASVVFKSTIRSVNKPCDWLEQGLNSRPRPGTLSDRL
jgi:hypothetical protein